MGKPEKPRHSLAKQTLVRISCLCGWFWRNDSLKGKDDADLGLEGRAELSKHINSMTAQGY